VTPALVHVRGALHRPAPRRAQQAIRFLSGPLLVLAAGACTPDPAPSPAEVHFVRGGVLTAGPEASGQPLGAYRFAPLAWVPGQSAGASGTLAPRLAECVRVGGVDLGDAARIAAAGGPAPDTDLAFSPDGSQLAVGSFRGEVLVIDVATSAILARRGLAESMVRRVGWAPDGKTLYAGEQSPDATLHALNPATLADRWTLRLADRVGSSVLPAGDDLYGIYSLPAAYGLEVLAGGDLLVSAAHGWTGPDGLRQNRSQLLRLTPEGAVRAAWPAEPADATLLHPALDEPGDRLAIPVNRTAAGPAPADLHVGGLQVLDLTTLEPLAFIHVPPLAPWYTETYLWQAQDVSVAQDSLLLGLGDGRVVLGTLAGEVRTTLAGGSPILAGDVPIAASVGHAFIHGDSAVFLTSGTNIPWGAAAPDLRPPTLHPGSNTLSVVGLDGTPRWSFRGDWDVQGMTLAPDDRTLVVGAGDRQTDTRRDLFGALVFDLGGEPRPGEARLLTTCATESPVFFRHAVSSQGVIAVTEVPFKVGEGEVAGRYAVSLFR
jgi:hypothetical protein